MTTSDRPRPHRPAPTPEQAPAEVRRTPARRVATAVRGWSDRMIAEAESSDAARASAGPAAAVVPRPNGTRWRRVSGTLVPSVAAVGGIGFLMMQGVLAASFNVSDQPFDLHVGKLVGKSLVAVPNAENTKGSSAEAGKAAVLHAGLASADLDGVCIVAHQSLLGLKFTVTVGSPNGQQSSGQNIYFDVTGIDATKAVLSNTILGKSADDITQGSTSMGGAPGGFGIDGSGGTVTLENIAGTAYQAQIAGSLTLPNLSIQVHPGTVDHC